jgi:hypothetical protein
MRSLSAMRPRVTVCLLNICYSHAFRSRRAYPTHSSVVRLGERRPGDLSTDSTILGPPTVAITWVRSAARLWLRQANRSQDALGELAQHGFNPATLSSRNLADGYWAMH